MSAPSQFSQPSRKGKKAWRKNVDVTDVQQGLETAREEVIAGGIVAEKPSEALFMHDAVGSNAIQTSYTKHNKVLKADEILLQRSAVPALTSQPHKKRKTTSKSEVRSLALLATGKGQNEEAIAIAAPSDGGAMYDVWDTSLEPAKLNEDPQFSFLPAPQPVKAPQTLRHKPVPQTASGRSVPAVPKPIAGKSYNPMFTDWDALVSQESSKEVEAERKRLAAAKAHQELLAKQAAVAASGGAQMEGKFRGQDSEDEGEESIWEGISEPEEQPEWLTKKRPVRKTQAQRNRILRHKKALRELDVKSKEKLKREQLLKVQALAREAGQGTIARKSADTSDASMEIEDTEEVTLRRRPFGKAPIPKQRLELVLPNELQDSLRLLKPEGNLIDDRWRNLLIRGKLESRTRVKALRRRRVKDTEKWSYKDWKLH